MSPEYDGKAQRAWRRGAPVIRKRKTPSSGVKENHGR